MIFPGIFLLIWLIIWSIIQIIVVKKDHNPKFKRILDNSFFNLMIVLGMIIFIMFLIPFSPQSKLVGEGMMILNYTGQFLIILGILNFLWIFLKKRRVGAQEMDKLLTNGAYGVSRHPIYVSHMLIFFGLIFEIGAFDTMLLAPVIIVMYIVTAKVEENYSIGKIFNNEYDTYRKSVPMFIKWWIIMILGIVFIGFLVISLNTGFLLLIS
ncbi:MAG: methyltransferase family protein [Promethearchaeota archaeon]